MLDSGAGEDHAGDCHVRLSALGYTLICELPKLLRDYKVRHKAQSWDAATIARLGRDWYDELFPCEYGLHFSEGVLHVHYGPQTHDSISTKSKCFFLPWKSWRHIRRSLYDAQGNHFWTERDGDRSAWPALRAVEEACPKIKFDFEDYDGERITATTHIEEREWRFGEKPFRWLSWFRRPQITRSLMLSFSAEVGTEKGSWKGGTVGHSIQMLPGETHEAAFRRYCTQDHKAKGRPYRLRYIGRTAVTVNATPEGER